MQSRWGVLGLVLLTWAAPFFWQPAAAAAPLPRPVLIGVLTSSWGPTPQVVGLRDGLTELGYVENRDFSIGIRFTQGSTEALYPAAVEMLNDGAHILVTVNTEAARAAMRATSRIPIVFGSATDPVGTGLVQSFARPGGNVTGTTDLGLELAGKRLELFRALIPTMKRVMVLYNIKNDFEVAKAKAYRQAAKSLGLVLLERPVDTLDGARGTIDRMRKDEVDGIVGTNDPSLNKLGFMLEAQSRWGIPAMFGSAFMLRDGGFASYGPSWYEGGRLAARMVDKIIKGAKPAEIPVEVNTKIEFAINLKAAKALGVKIAPEVLFQADRLIR